MDSHDIIRQSSRIVGLLKDKDKKLKHKIGEILLEIVIIVFAITLSFFVERWRQKTEDHNLEKTFLQGLKVDLSNDLTQLKTESSKWTAMKNAANYFSKPNKQINWAQDSINFYGYNLFHTVYFFPSTNRYEALKSIGKINVIEDNKLQNHIVDLYQTKIPDLKQQVNFFNEFFNLQVTNHLINNLKRDINNNPILNRPFFTDIKFRNIIAFYSIDDILKRSDSTINTSEEILKEIDESLK